MYRVPVRLNNGYQSFGDYLASSPGPGRSTSIPVEYPMAPPLPHHPQPHFFGVRDADLGFSSPRHPLRRATAGGFVTFDSLASSGDGSTSTTENVLLVGIERGLIIYSVEKNRIIILGRLEGFRGEVVGARVLQINSNADPFRISRPLISIIIHGPATLVEEARPKTSQSGELHDASAETTAVKPHNATVPMSMHQYQTTVEVYSLKDQRHVTTLFRSPVVDGEPLFRGMVVEPSLPVGNLSLSAKGRFLVLSSGISGEVYIFEVLRQAATVSEAFRCIGKTWTSVPARKGRSYSSSSASSEVESGQEGSPNPKTQSDAPIVSLSHRWLVLVPPPSSSRPSLQGTIDTKILGRKTPGLKSHSPPSQPQVSCELDPPDGESLLNRVARDVAQEVIKGASFMAEQGKQAWFNYWGSKLESSPPLQDYGLQSRANQQIFPPTHANDERIRASNQPALISVFDLEKLSATADAKGDSALQPIATFALPGGCSFVSLNPTGLSLLTASAKGDVQHVWDLMQMVYCKPGGSPINEKTTAEEKPTVRQIARFTRMTGANIVDIVWTEPKGERLVIITDKGTVHVFDLPAYAFQWPPPRRVMRPTIAASTNTEDTETANPSRGAFSTAVNIVSGTAQPLLASIRGRQSNITSAITGLSNINLTAGAAAGAGAKGGKLVAAGVGKTVAGTVNTIMHRGENRLHIPGAPLATVRGCVRWLSGQGHDSLAVFGSNVVQVYDVQQSTMVKSGTRRPSVVGAKPREFRITFGSPPSADMVNNPTSTSDPTASVTGSWPQPPAKPSKVKASPKEAATAAVVGTESPTTKGKSNTDLPKQKGQPSTQSPKLKGQSTTDPPTKKGKSSTVPPKVKLAHPVHAVHPLSFAEIETNAPYQPFHTDHRINLYVYDEPADDTDLHHLMDLTPWIPHDIPSTLVSSGAAIAAASQDASTTLEESPAGMENIVRLEDDADGGRQLVVTTRRRKGKKPDGEDDGIFDDADLVEFMDERV